MPSAIIFLGIISLPATHTATCKVQKIFNEVYHSFNTLQAPFILADFIS